MEWWNNAGEHGEQSGGPRSVVADANGGRDGARPSKTSFQHSFIPLFQADLLCTEEEWRRSCPGRLRIRGGWSHRALG